MNLPLVSCIVPVFNGETTLKETLQSIFDQTYSNLEILVVDDGSTDSTQTLLKSFSGKIKVLTRPHGGPSAARNLGVAQAKGEWIAFLDADDLWDRDKIRCQTESLQAHPEVQVSFTLVRNFWSPEAAEEKARFEKQDLLKLVHPFYLSSFLGKRSVFESLGMFREDLVIGEDSEWFARMEAGGVRYNVLPEEFVARRLHAKNLTRDLGFATREEIRQRTLEALQRSRRSEPENAKRAGPAGQEDARRNAEFFFEEVRAAFIRAEERQPDSLKKYYSIAGHSIELRFAGSRLADLMAPALEHLQTAPVSNPELSIGLCSFNGKEAEMPRVPWPDQSLNAKMEIPGYDDDQHIRAAYYQKQETLHLLHGSRNQAYFLVKDAGAVSQSDQGAPLVKILRWWMRGRGLQLVHGAVIGTPSAGILLAGQGGSGKSTTALTCLAEGFSYVSDDYCLLSTEPPYKAHSLYGTGKMHTAALGRIPGLKEPASSGRADLQSGKTLFFLNRFFPDQVVKELPVRAVFVPVISSQEESTLIKAAPIIGLKALAPSTLFQLPGSQKYDFDELAKIMEKLPCYVLRLGRSAESLTRVMKDYLKSLGPG